MSRVDARYQRVRCAGCGREYTCSPSEDYFHPAGFEDDGTLENGYCWGCFIKETAPDLAGQAEPKP